MPDEQTTGPEERDIPAGPPSVDAGTAADRPSEVIRTEGVGPDASPPRGVMAVFSEYRGQLPPPEMLREYEAILPGITERLLAEVERQTRHRQELEREVTRVNVEIGRTDTRYRGRGQVFAFVLGTVGLVSGSAVVMVTGTAAGATAGAAIGGATLVSIVTAFIVGRRGTDASAEPATPVD